MRAAAASVLVLALAGVRCSEAPREWSIGLYRGTSPLDLEPAGLNPVLRTADLGIDATFVADPFLLRRDDRLFLFFEAWRRGSGQGDIAWAERDASGAFRFSGVALDESFHLSYPFVFEHDGDVFMIPESRSQRGVRHYVARPFPAASSCATCSSRASATPTPRSSAGRDASTCSRPPTTPRSSSSTRTHSRARITLIRGAPSCPATTAPRRPGGRPIAWQGRILRFAQCDRPAYGVSVRAFEVTELSPCCYSERPAGRDPLLTGSGAGWNAGGMHHLDPLLDAGGVLAAVDGWRPVD